MYLSHTKENVSLLIFIIKSLFKLTHYPPKKVLLSLPRAKKSRNNTCRQAKRHMVLKGIWISIEKLEQWRTVCFLDPPMYEVWGVSSSNQKVLAGAQPAGLQTHLEEREVWAAHWLADTSAGRLLLFTVHVELLVKVNEEWVNQLQIMHDFKGIKVSPWNMKGDFSAIECIKLSMTYYQVFKNWSEVHPWSNLRPALSIPLNVTQESHLYHSAGIQRPRH